MLECQNILFVSPPQLLNWQALLFWWLNFSTWAGSPQDPISPLEINEFVSVEAFSNINHPRDFTDAGVPLFKLVNDALVKEL